MTKIWTPASLETGSRRPRTSTPQPRVSAAKVSGKTKAAFATGARSASRSIFPRARDSRVSGRTPRKNAAFSEYSYSLMRKIPESSLRGLKRLTRLVLMQILS